jgi:hypothetical protein
MLMKVPPPLAFKDSRCYSQLKERSHTPDRGAPEVGKWLSYQRSLDSWTHHIFYELLVDGDFVAEKRGMI